ncbi:MULTISPECIES: flavin reductase family protein [Dactylosporangium]|uniref:Flavin reductase like domain-containing protein n=2 Tax=Dactylosporangium TaxID=35753 RepID=A0A9W6NN47_9ACTN|nr:MULTISPECIES: flavin reductase family protein [Dactylosporangium]UAB97655.1 flavin reductase family protein [Dactylosporangium vinaceum]UWZ45899.1 flavin reductase family protein [Dactylosporangium matsuzakiense]GLL02936.1 hypothetical protein GCM10017581_046780 [Dactylosporangium matsuzakiense]
MPGAGPAGLGVTAADFRAFMGTFPSGVAIVTAVDPGGRPFGLTCSSVSSVATDPPTLLVCLRSASPTLAALRARAAFSVNLLHDEGRAAAELFASGDPDRFERIPWRRNDSTGGPHLTEHAHAIADCDVAGTTRVGDHMVVFGRVMRVRWGGAGPAVSPSPLLYGLRQYSSWRVAGASR